MKMISNDLRSSCRAMLIGAYQEGGGDTPEPTPEKWEYPSNWLQLPDPAENQIILLVDNRGGLAGDTSTYYRYAPNITHEKETKTTINWGDGTGEIIVGTKEMWSNGNYYDSNVYGHEYEVGSGHDTGKSEQWIVTITFDTDKEIGTEYFYRLVNITYAPTAKMFVLAIKIGNTSYIGNRSSNSFSLNCTGSNLQYAKICNGDFDFDFFSSLYLRKVELHEGITKLPKNAFFNSYSLFDINLENIVEVEQSAFYQCRYLDASGKMPKLTTIGNQAFAYSGITNLNFPCLTTIGASAFQSTFNFEKITLAPKTLTIVDVNAFNNCPTLKSVNLPYVTDVNNSAFSNCPELKTVDLRSCTNLGNNPFQNCYNLKHCILHTDTDVTGKFNSSLNVEIEYMEDTT